MGPPPDRLAAARRLDVALGLLAEGLRVEAAEAARAATEADPSYPEAWFTLGEAAQQAGETDAAEVAFRRYLSLAPDDRHGAVAHLVQLGRAPAPDRLPAAYVRALFDDYAPRFERALRESLGYRGPELLAAALDAVAPGRRFDSALDLGCGTGLMAPLLRPLLRPGGRLTGLDLAPAMLAQARRSGLYDALLGGELVAHLAAAPERHDLIVAADVLAYLGALAPMLAGVARCLLPGGLFAATLELHAGEGVRLQSTQRYAHGEAWLRTTLAAAGLRALRLEQASARHERGQPVPGLVLVATTAGG